MRPGNELAVHTRGLVAIPAVGTGVVGSGERADDELPGLDRPHRAADLLDDAAVFMPHRRGSVDRLKPAVRPSLLPTSRLRDRCVLEKPWKTREFRMTHQYAA